MVAGIPYAVRSDVHGRVDLSRRQFEQASAYAGLFDLGDVEAMHIDRDHPLRHGQSKGERTIDVIMRNAIRSEGGLTDIAKETVQGVLTSINDMKHHLRDDGEKGFCYRGIAGNAAAAWTEIFRAIASPDQQRRLREYFDGFDDEFDVIRECAMEQVNGSIVLYLPWGASSETLRAALSELDGYDPAKIVVLSHDYLTGASLKPEWQREVKPMQSGELAVGALDYLAQRDCDIVVCYGHIGFEYGPAEVRFRHGRREMTAYHTDEKGGSLLRIEL
ncbi:hypothetical protein J4460_08110 [Candidatus Woesearchaeota archaeon]|nr:MAG: hypothetical protein QS99_C0012G0070 [archaeon GW2011_AR4]MBS3130603.1 hypothetical protein [Candidatus Woesearchaeota archaeon]HIH39057.1 hypothetical protein [Candidatus Woesearchaeota archaeon]HIH48262.1 hypothetical protein [Candidatus Woesearchaeota archaeon]HIJ03824.1 hypothetical protein [Candidatus Woesearchaeota archaeon]